MRTVVVTGGCGFIGGHFVHELLGSTDWRVVNLDKLTYSGSLDRLQDVNEGPRYRFVRGDIQDTSLVDNLFHEEQPWALVNFAAESHVDRSILEPLPSLYTNIIGVQVLLDTALRYRVERFLQISTDEVYGDAAGQQAFQEGDRMAPSSPYAASKASADLLCLAHRRTYGTPVVIVRSSNNYGPFQYPEKLIPLMVRNALIKEPLPLYGDGLQQRDWLYVEDNVRALLNVLQRGRVGEVYNIAADEEQTNLEVVQAICRVLAVEAGRDLDALRHLIRLVADRPGHDRSYLLNSHKAQEELGWHPEISFEHGLRRTVRWYLDHGRWLERATSGNYQEYYESVYRRSWSKPKD